MTVPQGEDPIHVPRQFEIVRSHDSGDAGAARQVVEILEHRRGGVRIKVAGGLVG